VTACSGDVSPSWATPLKTERERELARQVINSVVSVRPSVYAYVSTLIVERLTFLCVYGSLITTGRRPGPVQFSSDHVT